MKKIENYINGKNQAISKSRLGVEDPSTGEQIAEVVLSSKEDFEQVVKISKQSQIEWANTTPLKRSRIISKYKTLIIELKKFNEPKNSRNCISYR